MKIVIASLLIFVSFSGFGQSDPKSEQILNTFSKEIKSLNSFYMEFSLHFLNKATGEDSKQKGNGFVQGDKFSAKLDDNEVISNGMKIWTIVHSEKVVYESDADDDDEESINPKKLLTIWETGFKSKYEKEDVINGKKVHVINLYPTNPAEVQYHTITLYVDVNGKELHKAIMKTKEGTTMTYTVTKMDKNIPVDKSKFVYDARKFPGYQLIRD